MVENAVVETDTVLGLENAQLAGRNQQFGRRFARLVPALPATIWIGLFIIAPMALMLVYSFWTYSNYDVLPEWTLDNYKSIFEVDTYITALGRTVMMAGIITIVTVGLAYPFAYFLAHVSRKLALVSVVLVMVPLWTNTVVRNYAWFDVLGKDGLVSTMLVRLGLSSEGLDILFTPAAVVIVGVSISLPFATLSLFPVLERISPVLIEAARDLGASPFQAFRQVTVPLSLAGIQTAVLLVFVPSLGLYLTPALLGGPDSTMIGNVVVPFFNSILNYPQGAALSLSVLLVVLVAVLLFGRSIDLQGLYASGMGSTTATRSGVRVGRSLKIYAVVFLAFLYTPIVLLTIFSFNQRSGFPLGEWTLTWYGQVVRNGIMLEAARNTLLVALLTALVSILVVTPLAYGMARFRYRWGRLIQVLILVPIVVPGFMLGAALLILLDRLGLGFSLVAVVIGHVTLVLPFAFLVLQAQQSGFDRSLEEAARDLGASNLQVFRRITLPLMVPALVAAALFAFTLSIDEFMVTFLLSGSTVTLPMYIYGLMKSGVPLTVNAIGTLLIGGAILLLVASQVGNAARLPRRLLVYQQRICRLWRARAVKGR